MGKNRKRKLRKQLLELCRPTEFKEGLDSPLDVVHKDWKYTVTTARFRAWLADQPPKTRILAASTDTTDAIELLDRYKSFRKAVGSSPGTVWIDEPGRYALHQAGPGCGWALTDGDLNELVANALPAGVTPTHIPTHILVRALANAYETGVDEGNRSDLSVMFLDPSNSLDLSD